LEQDEDLRCAGPPAYVFAEGGKVVKRIKSLIYPELYGNYDSLYIRGVNRCDDDRWFAYAYQEKSDAIQVVEDIKMLVAQINNKTPEVNDCGLEVIE